jgi:hypothetical protein
MMGSPDITKKRFARLSALGFRLRLPYGTRFLYGPKGQKGRCSSIFPIAYFGEQIATESPIILAQWLLTG